MMIYKKQYAGFSLVEMAIVLIILGFLLAALFAPLQAQRNIAFQTQTQNTINDAKKALLGFAQQQGRLPCPATLASNGVANPEAGGNCAQQVGFLPASTLGIQPTDENGFAVDAWGNRIRYAVTQSNFVGIGAATADFTSNFADNPATPLNEADGINVVGITNLRPDLRVCTTSAGVTAIACSAAPESNFQTNNAVAVIYSLGATGGVAAGGADETANLNPIANVDRVFVSHNITAAPNEFDHLVTWISPYVLYNALIESGQMH
jgi:type II secretory pathway pseudopilin PulG